MGSNATKPFTVFVEGNIGSGKTTFLEYFRQFENITVLPEPIEKWRKLKGWNLLELLYKDSSKWAVTFQSYSFLTRLDMHHMPISTPVKLMERSLFTARYCFLEQSLKSGNIHPAEYAVLDEWYKFINHHMPVEADLIVYLRTTPAIVQKRIKKRGRPEEQSVPLSLIEDLHQLHEDWLIRRVHGECPAPILVLNADLDRSQIIEEYKKSERQILSMAVDYVMSSPVKHSPRKATASPPIQMAP